MTLTAIVVGCFALLIVGDMVLRGLALWLGLKWVKTPHVSILRIAVVLILPQLLGLAVWLGVWSIPLDSAAQLLVAQCVAALLAFIASLLLIAGCFRLSAGRAFLAWLPTLVPAVGGVVFAGWVFVPHVIESFVVRGMSMAPTILGRHVAVSCPVCGEPGVAAVQDPGPAPESGPLDTICDQFHLGQVGAPGDAPAMADRFLSVKFLAPKRWDIITFRLPSDPNQTYVSRVIGLPGERIQVEDDAAWANGTQLSPPPEIAGITYLEEVGNAVVNGTGRRPAQLGEDEYFVLGDFSPLANDSRVWRSGAAGHARFAVPADHITGVVTHIYWPPGRMRVLKQDHQP